MKKLNEVDPQQINERLYPVGPIYEALSSPDQFTDDHVRLFWQQGFLAIEHLLNKAEITAATEAISDIIAHPGQLGRVEFTKPRAEIEAAELELSVRKVYQFAADEPRLGELTRHSVLVSLIERLLGERSKLVQDMALLKPPHGGGEKPWHQDMAYGPLAFNKAVIGAWIALDEAGVDNGCMHVIPYSQREGATPHYAIRDWQICDTSVPVNRSIAVPLKPGGVLLFHGLLYHGTPYNFSTKRRRALQFHYAPESAVKLGPKEYKQFFTNEMTNAEC
ncbi:phytanoyl-CoA dioxygenase family protein [Paenibacillus sp. GCM10027626]|uniref:phytanoyl-CoA dioxygenase family protein n=1 Tax=Paenibacillus sp. GCM10027626 TaxID=3273411 RepID=UPI00363EC6F0